MQGVTPYIAPHAGLQVFRVICGGAVQIRIGLAVEHDNFSNLPVCWRYYSHKGCGGKKWEKVCEQIDKNSEARDSRLYERWRLSGQKDKHKEDQREVRKTIQAKLQSNPLSTSHKAPKPPPVPTLAKPHREKEKKGKEAKGKQRRSSARKSARSRGPGSKSSTRTSSSSTSRAMSPKSSRPESAGKTADTEHVRGAPPSAEAKEQASEGESALVEPQARDQPTSHPLEMENEPSESVGVPLVPAADAGLAPSGKALTEGAEARAAAHSKAEKGDVAEDAASSCAAEEVARENETSEDHDRPLQDEGKLKTNDSGIHIQDTRVDDSQDESSSSSSTSESDSSDSDSSESDSDESNGCQTDE
ncbi:hypothetical protein CYMTET_27592 [Cymbomonas tetramitiformis]|uniref:Uncharacterized protein n=1 Tax=Cymbomonas tetramitiformis TaxID=36881 RepID=A0AAE0KX11_9CHLO|nr:hypothetical protein CYMTET_27592 [Cymbomonas tetramitiformis]